MGKSVADGKSAIASAITNKGVSTASDATFNTMAANIKNIKTTFTIKSQTKTANLYVHSNSTGSVTITFDNLTRVDGVSAFGMSYAEGTGAVRDVSHKISGNTVIISMTTSSTSSVNEKFSVTAFEIA